MAEIGSGNNSSYPGGIDTNATPEVNSPASGKTRARKEPIEDLAAAVIAIENELGTDPAGSLSDVKTFLQLQHQTDGTHKSTHGPHVYIDESAYANFSAAVAAAPNKTLVVARSINLDANTVIASSVSLMPVNPGVINANGFTLTINGPVVGDPMHQWLSGFSAGEVIINPAKNKEVYPDWWNVNTTPGTTDMTTALKCALASKAPVQLFGTTYGHTGGLQLGIASRVLKGVSIGYESVVYGIPQVGTILKKLSGTLDSLTVLQSPYTALKDITFDGNSLGGRQLYSYASSASGKRLRFENQGGTDYAFHYSGNTSKYSELEFADGCYGGLKCDTTVNGLYGEFDKVTCGAMNDAGFGLLVNGGAKITVNGIHMDSAEGAIKLTGYLQNVTINNLSLECEPTTVSPIVIDGTGTTMENVSINGIRIYANGSAAVPSPPIIQIIEAKTIKLNDFYFLRNNADISTIIELDNVENLAIDGVTIANNISGTKFIECVTACDRISLENTENHSGTPYNTWKGTRISVRNSDFKQTFLATSNYIECVNVSGEIDTTNATQPFTAINCSNINDVAKVVGLVERRPKFRATKGGTNQTINNATGTKMTFTTEGFDDTNTYDATNSKWIPGINRTVSITAMVRWVSAVDQTLSYLYVYINGIAVAYTILSASGTATQTQTINFITEVNDTDYIEIYVMQESGGALDILGQNYASYFMGAVIP